MPLTDIPLDLETPPKRKVHKRDARGRILPKNPPPPVHQAPSPPTTIMSERTFAGITPGPNGDCCDDCEVDRCVITLIGFCGHPSKGALQSTLQNNPKILARRRFVKRMLDDMMLDAKKD